MKTVVAIIRPERLSCLKQALKKVKTELVTVRVRGAHPDIRVHTSLKLRVEMSTEDFAAEEVVDAIRHAIFPSGGNCTNGGRIFVVSHDSCRELSEREHEELSAPV